MGYNIDDYRTSVEAIANEKEEMIEMVTYLYNKKWTEEELFMKKSMIPEALIMWKKDDYVIIIESKEDMKQFVNEVKEGMYE